MLFFFFKQKTAYEMRISDWSSDVCSSDLFAPKQQTMRKCGESRFQAPGPAQTAARTPKKVPDERYGERITPAGSCPPYGQEGPSRSGCIPRSVREARSEEHTSELQSLMRISYAVFCLKKKKHTKTHQQH